MPFDFRPPTRLLEPVKIYALETGAGKRKWHRAKVTYPSHADTACGREGVRCHVFATEFALRESTNRLGAPYCDDCLRADSDLDGTRVPSK